MKLAQTYEAWRFAAVGAVLALFAGCTPEVHIKAPEKPIVINLNVKIEQEIRVKVEKDIDELLSKNKDLF